MRRLAFEMTVSVFVFVAVPAMSCEVRLRHALTYTCPAVTYGPEDCSEDAWGTAGQLVTSPALIHVMTGGHSYYCPSHESCIERKDLSFSGCRFVWVPRFRDESKEYLGHYFLRDKKLATRYMRRKYGSRTRN
jgi:hypothetical protein